MRLKKTSKTNDHKLIECFKFCFLYDNFVLINQLIDNIKFDGLKDDDLLFKKKCLNRLIFNDDDDESENIRCFLKFIDTPFYNLFIDYLLNYESKDRIRLVIKVLKENNYLIEASYLLANLNNTHGQYGKFFVSTRPKNGVINL